MTAGPRRPLQDAGDFQVDIEVRLDPTAVEDEVLALQPVVEPWLARPALVASESRFTTAYWSFSVSIAWSSISRLWLTALTNRVEQFPGIRVQSYVIRTSMPLPADVHDYLAEMRLR